MKAVSALFSLALCCATSAMELSCTLPPGSTNKVEGPVPLTEGMKAWSSDDLWLLDTTERQLEGTYLDMGAVTVPQSTVTLRASPDKPAMLYAFVYACYPCPATQDGILTEMVTNENWRLGYCAPIFHNKRRGRSFRLISFAKDLAPGESYTLTIPGETQYLSFLATEDFPNCPAYSGTDRATCTGGSRPPAQHCKWNAATETCEFAFCHGNVGPTRDVCPVEACASPAQEFL